jgi:beta-lactamase class A
MASTFKVAVAGAILAKVDAGSLTLAQLVPIDPERVLMSGTVAKDKTGTIGGTLNDVGIIDLPDGRGHIIVAVYIKKSPKPFEAREQVIAQIGRSIYDYMLIESAASQETKHEGH